jgi:hypothetical protein
MGNLVKHLRAERTGSTAEATILGTLRGRGYQEQASAAWTTGEAQQTPLFAVPRAAPVPAKLVMRQCPVGTNLYGTPAIADFVLSGAPAWPHGLAIESKWQHAQGSVDEKLPFLVLSIKAGYRVPAIIVADGGGHRPEALRWLRAQVDGQQLLAVLTLVEFLTWANHEL